MKIELWELYRKSTKCTDNPFRVYIGHPPLSFILKLECPDTNANELFVAVVRFVEDFVRFVRTLCPGRCVQRSIDSSET